MKVMNMLAAANLKAVPLEIHPEWKSIIPAGGSGNCRIEKFDIDEADAKRHNLRCILHAMNSSHFIHPGSYTKLVINGDTMMSDTQKEYLDHADFFKACAGEVLIMGLGLGCAASVVASMPEVTKVTIIEISADVITLVAPTLWHRFGKKVEIVMDDAFTWQPPDGKRYSAAWFDIWLNICDTNLPEMTKLKKRFKRRCDWMGCWSEEEAKWMKGVVGRMKAEGYDID